MTMVMKIPVAGTNAMRAAMAKAGTERMDSTGDTV